MANYSSFDEYRNAARGNQESQSPGQSANLMNWNDFRNYYQQVAQANQAFQQQMPESKSWYDDRLRRSREYQQNQGTYDMYNGQYRDASLADAAAIEFGKWGEFWNNLPGQIAGVWGDQARNDWTFDASKFDLSDGLDTNDLDQARNFVFSLPGMLVGGVFEGVNKGYEAVTGTPVQEYREKEGGGYEVADYQLDASQRAAAGIDSAINLAGTLTGGAGRVIGGIGKAGARVALSRGGREFAELAARGASEAEQRAALRSGFDAAKASFEQAVARQDLIDGMSKGVVTRAMEGAKGGGLGTAAGLVADMGDEAVEEFVQSYADDIRMKNLDEHSLDRAMTGAAWGAAGGLLMGAGGRLLSHATQIDASDQSRQNNPVSSVANTEPGTLVADNDSLAALRATGRDGLIVNARLEEQLKEQDANNRYVSGSSVFMQTGTDSDMDFDDLDLGVENVSQIFYRDQRSREKLARAFNTTVENLHAIFRSGENVAAKLNELMKSSPRGTIQVAVGRNPDTKNGGFYANIRQFHEGQKFTMHPAVMQLVGSDWDGDRASVYFDPNNLEDGAIDEYGAPLKPYGYVSEMLMDPEGKSNIEWIFAGISKNTSVDEAALRAYFGAIFRGYKSTFANPSSENGESVNIKEYFVRGIIDALSIENDAQRDAALSMVLRNLAVVIDAMNAQYSNEVIRDGLKGGQMPGGRRVLNDFIHEFLTDKATLLQKQLETYIDVSSKRIVSILGYDPDTQEGKSEIENMRKAIYEWQSTGSSGGNEVAFQMTKSLGLLTYLADPDSKYNPIYRQYGGVRYAVNSIPAFDSLITDLAAINGVEPVVMNILRSAFRLAKPGVDPTVAIESLCDKMVIAEVSARLSLSGNKIRTANQLKEFERVFVEVQSKYARIYNEAHSGITSQGFKPDKSASYRNPLDGITKKHGNDYEVPFTGSIDKDTRKSLYRQFSRIYSSVSISDIFHNTVIDAMPAVDGNIPLGRFLEEYSDYAIIGNPDLLLEPVKAIDADIYDFLKESIANYGSEVDAIGMEIERLFANFDFGGMLNRYNKNGKHIDPSDVPMLSAFMDLLYEYIGADNAIAMNFICSDEFIDSDIGKLLFSGDPDQIMRVVTSASLYGQFVDKITLYNSDDEVVRKSAEENLLDMRAISPIHEMIVDGILDGNDAVFKWFTSTSMNLKDKLSQYNLVMGTKFGKGNYVVSALQTENGRFAVSSISAKTKKAQIAKSLMEKRKYDAQLEEVNEFLVSINETTNKSQGNVSALEEWFADRTKFTTMRYNDEILAMKILASLTVDNAYVEKATIPEIIASMYNAAEIGENGGLLSQLNLVTSAWSGKMDVGDWLGNRTHMLMCASDPEYECWVWDPEQGKNVLMNQVELFRSAGVEFHKGQPVQSHHIQALLRAYPQYAGYLCEPTSTVAAVGGSLTAQLTRETSLKEDFESWQRGRAVSTGATERTMVANVDKALGDIRSALFASSDAHKLITLMVPPEVFEGHIDPREFVKEITHALDHLSQYALYRVMAGGVNSNLEEAAIADNSFIESTTADLTTDLWQAVAAANDLLAYDADLNIKDAMMRSVMRRLVNASVVNNILKEQGVDVSAVVEDRNSGVVKAIANDVIDATNRTMKICGWLLQNQMEDYEKAYRSLAVPMVDRDWIAAELVQKAGIDEATALSMVDQAVDDINLFGKNEPFNKDDLLVVEDFADQEKAKAKMNRLMSWNREYQIRDGKGKNKADRLIENINEIESESSRNKAIEDAVNDFNKQLIRHELVEISAITHMPINENAIQLRDQAQSSMRSLVNFVEGKLRTETQFAKTLTADRVSLEAELKRRGGMNYKTPPRFTYISQTMQSSISNQTASDPAAGNPTKVGVNGSLQKMTFPFAHIPQSLRDKGNESYSFGRTVDLETLEIYQDVYKKMSGVIVNEKGEREIVGIGSDAFKNYVENTVGLTEVVVFHPEDNPHGLPTYNQFTAAYDPDSKYHRLSGIFRRITDFSMEAMVLKTKKLLRVTDHITVKRPIHFSSKGKISNADFVTIEEGFRSYRGAYWNALTAEFGKDGSMADLGFGRDQALIIVQALTPGVLLDVQYTDGSIHKVMADASLLLGDGAQGRFEAFIAETMASNNGDPDAPQPKAIVAAQVASVSVSEAGYRIMGAVSKVANGSKKAISAGEAEAAGFRAMADWSDYGSAYEGGSVRSLVSKMPPVGYNYHSAIPATDNPVPPMVLLDAVWKSGFGNNTKSSKETKGKRIPVPGTERDAELFEWGRKLNLMHEEGPLPIAKAWTPGEPKASDFSEMDNFSRSLLHVIETNNYAHDDIYGAFGVVTDPRKLHEAINWARSHGGSLLILDSIAESAYIPRVSIVERGIKIGGGSFVHMSGFNSARYSATRERNPKSGKRSAQRSTITTTVVVDPNMKMPGLLPDAGGDATIMAFSKVWNRAIRTPFNTQEIPMDRLLPDNGKTPSFITKAQARELLAQVAEDGVAKQGEEGDEAFRKAGFLLAQPHVADTLQTKDTLQIKDLIVKYLLDIVDGSDRNPNDPQPKVARRNEVAGLVTDGMHITPVIYPNMPLNVEFSWVSIANNAVVIHYGGTTPMFEEGVEGSQKWEIDGETFKGMVMRAAADLNPSLFCGEGLDKLAIDFAINAETERSRVGGMDDIMLANALYYTMKLNDMSLFYVKNSDGSYSYSDALQTWGQADRDTFNNNPSREFFERILSGELRLSLDEAQNKALIQVFSAILQSNKDPRFFFSNYVLDETTDKNGNTVVTRRNFTQPEGGGNDWYIELDHKLILQNIIPNPDKLLRLFNAVDSKLCPNGFDDPRIKDDRQRTSYIVGVDGTSLVDFGDGELVPMTVRYGRNRILGETTLENTPNGMASVSGQHVGARGTEIGYTDGTVESGINSNYIATGHYDEALDSYLRRRQRSMGKEHKLPKYTQPIDMQLATLFPTATRSEIRRNQAVVSCLKETFTRNRVLMNNDGRTAMTDLDFANSKTAAALGRFNGLLDPGKEWSFSMIEQLAKCATATSWSDNVKLIEIDGKRVWPVYDTQLAEAIDHIIDSITGDKHLLVTSKFDDFSDNQGRYQMALIPKEIAMWAWNSIETIREAHGSFEEFVDKMKTEQNRCDKAINAIAINKGKNKSRWIALSDMSRALWLSYNDVSTVLPAVGDLAFPEINQNLTSLASTLSKTDGWSEEQVALFKALCEESEEKYEYVRTRLEEMGYVNEPAYKVDGDGQKVAYSRIDEARDITNMLNNLAELSKVMAVINPMLTVGNLVDRNFHQGTMRANIFLGNRLRLGPYKSKKEHIVPSKIRKMAVESEGAIELYASMREMEFNSEEVLLISRMIKDGNAQNAIEFARERKEKLLETPEGKVKDFAYKSASGGNIGLKAQMQNVIDRFVMFAEADGQTFWFEPAGKEFTRENGEPMTRLDAMLAQPGGFMDLMVFCLSPDSPSYSIFCQAMNSAKQGDMAQKNAVGLVLNEICRKVPFGNFIMTTAISRFPMYGLNVTGRLANYVLPVSSMNRAFNELLAKTKLGKKLGVEEVNVHTSMREAMMVDICKLGVGGTAIALFAISGAIQPPDDERKWGNVDEWLVFGTRAGENWWVEDILGMALPLACFWKACEQGKPRFDIITTGIANICYSNPVLRCGDIASFLMNPAESMVSDYNETIIQFQNAKGGAPDFGEYLMDEAFSFGLNWASQFVTPSIVKEWWRASQPFEKSYKRYWETSSTGAITEAGRAGKTEYVTYGEAVQRKLAIRNPLLALLFSISTGKSYWPGDMPDTVYYDDSQLESSSITSVAGLEGEERMAKVVQLIAILQSYEDMDELVADGFHVDYETLQAIASQVWDNYHAVDDWYNTLQAEGKLNYYYLGGGDYNEGARIAAELKKERDNLKQYWYDFYYKKLKDSPIANTMQQYNRYNTTYATDVNGTVYATGIRRSPYNFLPFTTAPGTISSPEGTAGYQEDFNSVSAVTGRPLSQRALIPSDSGNMSLPDFEALSSDGSGNKYSKQYEEVYGSSASINSATTASYSSYQKSGNSGGSGGYRSGGSGGSGGGGRSYAPNTSAPSASLSKANSSRIMNTDRIIKPDLDYLRPNFETKGSREAYKRSDI